MENEGIMSLPAGADMQGGERQLPAISSADAYDAATQALELKNPGALAPYRQSIRNKIAQLDLSPEQIGQFVILIEFLMQDPAQYRAKLKQLIQSGLVDEGQLPEEFDAAFLGTMLGALQEYRMMRSEGARPPEMPGMSPMPMAEGGLVSVAQRLQDMGRNGDTILAHINPQEAALLKRMGGAGTINPKTGLLEFNFLKDAWNGLVGIAKDILRSPIGKIAATVAIGAVLGPSGLALVSTPVAGAIAGGTVALAGGGSLKEAVIGSALGYVGGGGEIGGMSPLASLQSSIGGLTGAAPGTILNTGLTAGALGTGAGLAMGQSPGQALRTGALSGLGASAYQGLRGTAGPLTPETGTAATPIQQAAAAAQGAPVGAEGAAPVGIEAVAAPATPGLGLPSTAELAAAGQATGAGIGALPTAQELVDVGNLAFDVTAPTQPVGNLAFDTATPRTGGMGVSRPATVNIGGVEYEIPPMSNVPYSQTSDAAQLARAQALENIAAGGTAERAAATGTTRTAAQGAASTGRGMFDRITDFAKDPSFENLGKVLVDPTATTFVGKYGPGAAIGLGAAALGGAFKREQPDLTAVNAAYRPIPFQYTPGGAISRPAVSSTNVGVATPELFGVGSPATPAAPSLVPPLYLPTGITNQPQGILQPYNIAGLYNIPRQYYSDGGTAEYPRKTGAINGPGTGTSDSIPAMLSDGEFVFTAKAVRSAGGGSRRKGAKRMYKLMRALEHGGMIKG